MKKDQLSKTLRTILYKLRNSVYLSDINKVKDFIRESNLSEEEAIMANKELKETILHHHMSTKMNYNPISSRPVKR